MINEIEVIDNFLTDEQNQQVIDWFEKGDISRSDDAWFLKGEYTLIEKMISRSGVSEYIGYEAHFNPGLPGFGPHIDKDEALCERTGEIKCPLISIVYYPIFEGTGGQIVLENQALIEIKPKRLLIFNSSFKHWVLNLNGSRLSLGINPWEDYPERWKEN